MKITLAIAIVLGLIYLASLCDPYPMDPEKKENKENNVPFQGLGGERRENQSHASSGHGKPDSPLSSKSFLPLAIAAAALDTFTPAVEQSLDGRIVVDELLDAALEAAMSELDTQTDLDHWDQTSASFALGNEAHFFVERERTSEGLRAAGIRIEIKTRLDPYILAGVAREGPRLDVTLLRDESGNVVRMSLLVQCAVDLAKCRDLGIDAFSGAYRDGIIYNLVLDGQSEPSCASTGIVNGHIVQPRAFPDPLPCWGSLIPDKAKILTLNERISSFLSQVERK